MQYLMHMPHLLIDVLRLSIWLVLLSVIFVPLERLFALNPQKIFRRGIGVDLFYYFLNSLFPAMVLSVPLAFVVGIGHRFLPWSYVAALSATPLWLRAIAALLVAEVGFYWGHRWSHEIPLLWRFHAVHHSAEEMDFLVNTRAHVVDMVFTRLCGLVPLYLLGLANPINNSGTLIPFMIAFISVFWGFFIHSNVRWRLGPLEWFISTPAFHHWHHNFSDPIDKNYASVLAGLDRLFGTFHTPKGLWPKRYGIADTMPNSLPEQIIRPLLPQHRVAVPEERRA